MRMHVPLGQLINSLNHVSTACFLSMAYKRSHFPKFLALQNITNSCMDRQYALTNVPGEEFSDNTL